jgi:hypothetical protein
MDGLTEEGSSSTPEYDFHVQKVLEVFPYLNLCTSKALKEPNVQEKNSISEERRPH